jgi:hypothetical protein
MKSIQQPESKMANRMKKETTKPEAPAPNSHRELLKESLDEAPRDPIAGELIDSFKDLIGLLHSSDLEWSIYDHLPSNVLVKANFDALLVQVKHVAQRERTNAHLPEALDLLVHTVNNYRFIPNRKFGISDPEYSNPKNREMVLLAAKVKLIEEIQSVQTGITASSQAVRATPATFAHLWGQENLDKLLFAMKSEGIAYVTDGRGGKERIMAAFHAGAVKFGHPRRLMDWQGLLMSQYPGSVVSDKVKPKDLDTASERYKGVYSAILRHLTE